MMSRRVLARAKVCFTAAVALSAVYTNLASLRQSVGLQIYTHSLRHLHLRQEERATNQVFGLAEALAVEHRGPQVVVESELGEVEQEPEHSLPHEGFRQQQVAVGVAPVLQLAGNLPVENPAEDEGDVDGRVVDDELQFQVELHLRALATNSTNQLKLKLEGQNSPLKIVHIVEISIQDFQFKTSIHFAP